MRPHFIPCWNVMKCIVMLHVGVSYMIKMTLSGRFKSSDKWIIKYMIQVFDHERVDTDQVNNLYRLFLEKAIF